MINSAELYTSESNINSASLWTEVYKLFRLEHLLVQVSQVDCDNFRGKWKGFIDHDPAWNKRYASEVKTFSNISWRKLTKLLHEESTDSGPSSPDKDSESSDHTKSSQSYKNSTERRILMDIDQLFVDNVIFIVSSDSLPTL
jgi:hypothetical protein